MVSVVKAVVPATIPAGIVVNLVGNLKVFNLVAPQKTLLPKEWALSAPVTFVSLKSREVRPVCLKAAVPIELIELDSLLVASSALLEPLAASA